MEYIGAVDIGGTKILVGIVDEFGEIICNDSFHTELYETGAINSCNKIVFLLESMQNKYNIKISRLGIVSAGPVDSNLGTIENPFTLPGWENFNIVNHINLVLNVKVYLENDVNGILLGEIVKKNLYNKTVLVISIGTGIGVAYYDGNKLFKTSGRFHPELGHQIVDIDGEECYCKNKGCFESLCSGKALNKRSKALGYGSFNNLRIASEDGNTSLNSFMNRVELQYKNGFWNLLTVFKPNVFILGGGFAQENMKFFKYVFEKYFIDFEEFIGKPMFLPAQEHGLTALIGASKLK